MEIKIITPSDWKTIEGCAALLREHSWGHDYPIHPLVELKTAEHIIGAYEHKKLVGCAYVHRNASPDGKDNGEHWLCGAVVHPDHRNQGIFGNLFEAQMEYVSDKRFRILTCTDNPIVESFLLKLHWRKIRDTKDEKGDLCAVFEFDTNTSE